jgi:isoleucyl-tRNA synthetase
MKFNEFKDNFSLPKAEEDIIAFWEENDVFHKSHDMAKDKPHFVFYEGPPTANGRPGIHHVISRTVKDLVCRYKAMQGFRVDRKGGWDTHGLPVEIEVEKALGLTSKSQVVEYGIDKFNEKCRESVFKYLEDWNNITRRIGYWLDLDDAYVTLTNDYIESVWWILKNFFDRDLIYQDYKTVPYCPRCGTGLSSHEVAQGYSLIKDPSVYIKVKAADDDFSYLVWTTTPWTLPSNAALCMKPDADYVMVEYEDEKLVLAEALVDKIFGGEAKILSNRKGADFLKRKYVPLFDTFKSQADLAYFVINADFVTLDDGTGIVHIAPGFGADDYVIGKEYGLPVFQAIENNGIFKDFAVPYNGMFIKDADPIITEDLDKAGRLFKKELYEHNYPFCWRCDSPLVYIAQKSWYLKTTDFKQNLLDNNNKINWHPDDIRTGRMLNWLENNVDWALSRERFWGTPIPIWICDDSDCGKMTAVGSIEQLRNEAIELPDEIDLHKPMMDEVKLSCSCGKTMSRIPEVVDVWFDSGAMPYAQWHYPFENKEEFENKYPSDFISEAVDQTRGWFYSLLAISTVLFDQPPFKNVIVLEFILDKEGKKMSKHKGNVVDPFPTVDKYGADPVRWYLVSASNPWLPTRFDLDGLSEVVRKYFDTLRNTYSFFALYANIDNVADRAEKDGLSIESYLESKAGEPERFDKWIISKYNSLVKEVVESFDGYEITRPIRSVQNFVIEELSNWYVRNNRRRFWAKEDDPSKIRAYLTLYQILEGVCRLTAPVTPMVSEMIWHELAGEHREKHGLPLSVHMMEFPKADESLIDKQLEESMDLAEKVVSLGRAARSRKNIKVRQPISRILIGLPKSSSFESLESLMDIIKNELNIKSVESADDFDQYISYSAKLNFKTAGPKLGGMVKEASSYIASLNSESVKKFEQLDKKLEFELNGTKLTLTEDDIDVHHNETEGFAVESENQLSIALDTTLSDDLINEGFAREIINKVQNMRKSSGFDVTDKIETKIKSTEKVVEAVKVHENFICSETLSNILSIENGEEMDFATEWNINGEKAYIKVTKQ